MVGKGGNAPLPSGVVGRSEWGTGNRKQETGNGAMPAQNGRSFIAGFRFPVFHSPIRSLCSGLLLLAFLRPAFAAAEPVVRVGLFLADGSEDSEAAELRRGAELAAQECGETCSLLAAAQGGQWSAGAGGLVRLVYTEGITAVLGSADNRSAHLAEQVAARAKGRFVLLTPWASDPSLTQIKVPWFFRLVPDDRRQAEALLHEIHRARALPTAVAIVAADTESHAALESLKKGAPTLGVPPPREIHLGAGGLDRDRFATDVRAAGAQALLILAPPAIAAQVVRSIRAAGVTLPFFGPLRLATRAFLDAAGTAAEGMTLAAPAPASSPAVEQFRARYRARYQREPSTPAAYGYDGAIVLIDALRSTRASDGESVAAALAATRRAGLTGHIEFDRHGNRAGPAALAQVEHGQLQAVHCKEALPEPSDRLVTPPQPGMFHFVERISR